MLCGGIGAWGLVEEAVPNNALSVKMCIKIGGINYKDQKECEAPGRYSFFCNQSQCTHGGLGRRKKAWAALLGINNLSA